MDIEKIIEKAIEMFGILQDPEVHPRQFQYQLKLAAYELSLDPTTD